MFQVAVLASGSKGNSIIIRTEKAKILLDAGLSGNKILTTLHSLYLDEGKLDAVIISHEHLDHIRGAGIICRKLKIPLYITEQTYMISAKKLGNLPIGVRYFSTGEPFRIKDIIINPFSSSHNAVDCSNFVFQKEGDLERKLAVVIDVGFSSRLMLFNIKNSTTIILESNHDEKMLIEGPYSWELKQRVKSRHGHLSNKQAVKVIENVVHSGLKNLVLAHLSETNNTPEIAKSQMEKFLKRINHKLNLVVASQYEPTKLLDI